MKAGVGVRAGGDSGGGDWIRLVTEDGDDEWVD